MPRSFLLIGIALKELSTMVGPQAAQPLSETILAGIKRDTANFAAAGSSVEIISVGAEEGMDRVETQLKQKKYDGVCIGFGIRSHQDFTPLFESLVDTVHTTSPASKLIFNTAPDGSFDAAKRWFPELEQGSH